MSSHFILHNGQDVIQNGGWKWSGFEARQKKEYSSTCSPKKGRPNQKPCLKLSNTCISRMTVDYLASHSVQVTYYAAHTGHTLNTGELTESPPSAYINQRNSGEKPSIGVTAE